MAKTSSVKPKSKTEDPDKTLAIISLVLVFFMPLIGLVLAIVAKVQSRKKGFSNQIALVSIILNAVFTFFAVLLVASLVIFGVFLFSNISGASKRDDQRKSDIAYLGKQVEHYVNLNGYFPQELNDLNTLGDFKPTTLKDPKGNSYIYQTTPAGCDRRTNCTGYKIYISPEVVVNGKDELNYINSYSH